MAATFLHLVGGGKPMIKVTVMYPNSPGVRFDHAYYRDKHMPLVKARMGDHCKYYTVDKGIAGATAGSPPTYIAMCHILSVTCRRRPLIRASGRTCRRSWPTFPSTPMCRRCSRSARSRRGMTSAAERASRGLDIPAECSVKNGRLS